MGRWQPDSTGSKVCLELHDGKIVFPTALDIFDAEYEDLSQVHGETCGRPSSDLEGVSFDPSFAPFVFSLERLSTGVVLKMGIAGHDELILETMPDGDQLLVSNLWFPTSENELADWRRELAEKNISLNSPLAISQILWLLWEWDAGVQSELTETDFLAARSDNSVQPFSSRMLKADLYPYQISGSQFLTRNADASIGAVLADEMGLGKTMQVMYLLAYKKSIRAAKPSLVVVLSSNLANWQRELKKFAPHLLVYNHSGPRRSGAPDFLKSFDVVLTSYETLTRDRYLLESVDFSTVVLDEAQAIKNSFAQRSIAAKSLRRDVSVAVTGTPIETSLQDMWSIFEFVRPSLLGSLDEFRNTYPDDLDAAKYLSQRVAPLTLRRTVAEVAQDLPPRVDIETPVLASPAFAKAYNQIRQLDLLPLVKMLRLRQLCSHATEGHSGQLLSFRDSPKLERLLELLEDVFGGGNKALVFAPFTLSLDLLTEVIRGVFPNCFTGIVDGRNSPADRQKLIDDFTETKGPGVLVLNPRAAGTGLNIQAANYVIHFSPEWNPAVVSQASARSHRRGQEKPVFVYYMYYRDTVEQTMMERLNQRRSIAEAGMAYFTDGPTHFELAGALSLAPQEDEGQSETHT